MLLWVGPQIQAMLRSELTDRPSLSRPKAVLQAVPLARPVSAHCRQSRWLGAAMQHSPDLPFDHRRSIFAGRAAAERDEDEAAAAAGALVVSAAR